MLRGSYGILAVLVMALVPVAASADAYGDLVAAQKAFTSATSWHAVEQMPNGRTVIVDHVSPDRWRIQPTPTTTELLVGNGVYLIHNGKATRVPIPGSMLQKTIDQFMVSYPSDVKATAKDLGFQNLNGRRVHVYSYTTAGTPVTIFVGSNHLPVQSIVKASNGTTTITYSQWNSPSIAIAP
jgi:hypothetical protein